jgi:hypothetical protein
MKTPITVHFVHKHFGIITKENVTNVHFVRKSKSDPCQYIGINTSGERFEELFLIENISDLKISIDPPARP